jgi:REP element-mobilizing transposase RayT
MGYNREVHHRRSIRLRGYDYGRPGAYFLTVCTRGGRQLFGAIDNGEMCLREAGQVVAACWNDLPQHYPCLSLDEFVVMPNHVHGILILADVGAGLRPAPTNRRGAGGSEISAYMRRHGVPEIVRAFKSFSARRINEVGAGDGQPVWQRNYYEHIIRGGEMDQIREYIRTNPLRWACDRYNPARGVMVIDETARTVPWEES